MLDIQIEITGITALICNRFHDAAAEAASSGSRGSSAGADRGTPSEICKLKLYLGLDGEPMIPQPNLLRCLVDGGKFHKIGRSQVTTKSGSLLFSCVSIDAAEIKLHHRQPWRVDTRPIRIPATGGRILAHRPAFDDWRLVFEVKLDTAILGPKLFRAIVDDAGKKIGLGDFRPATKGPYGRFLVTRWVEEVVDDDLPVLAEAAE